jgi:5'-3' exonuclease
MFRGDPSDGLPGVKGIGEKGAAVIANNFATVEDALAAALEAHESLPPALAKKIIAGADYLKIAPKLVRVARDAPLPKVDLSLPKAPADLSAIYQFKERYALGASVDRLISALGW